VGEDPKVRGKGGDLESGGSVKNAILAHGYENICRVTPNARDFTSMGLSQRQEGQGE